MILDIVQVGDPVLRNPPRPVAPQKISSPEIKQLIANMRETMRDAPGVGLAAPQIGVPLQIAVIEDPDSILEDVPPQELALKERRPIPFHVMINPVIVSMSEDTAHFYEGCLSLAGFSAVVSRARTVRVEYLDERGKARAVDATGWYARILQHEIDHLRGTLYIDRMRSRTFTSLENWNLFRKGKPIPAPLPDPPKS